MAWVKFNLGLNVTNSTCEHDRHFSQFHNHMAYTHVDFCEAIGLLAVIEGL